MHPNHLIPSRRTLATLMAVASTMPAVITSAEAQSYSGLAQREMIRRQNDIAEAERMLNEGREVYAKGDYQAAVTKYRQALAKVPNVPTNPALVQRRQAIMQHFADASVALAMQNRKVGKYDEARALLEAVVKEDPNNFVATRELGYLDDPIRTNPALTYEHTKNVDKVRRSLYMAEGQYNLGKYDEAKKEYENVIRIDPYNSAARRGLQRLAQARSDYYRAAFDHTRAELLAEVDKAWELTVPAETPDFGYKGGGQGKVEKIGTAYITNKLRNIVIPEINFEDITVEEAIDFLRQRSKELDTIELDPAKKGVNFVIRRPRGSAPLGGDAPLDAPAGGGDMLPVDGGKDPSALRIRELRVTNVPLEQALKYICDETNLKWKLDEYSVTLVPKTEDTQEVFTRTFNVPPTFQTSLQSNSSAGGAAKPVDPFEETASTTTLNARPPVIELLKTAGVNFGNGASASLSDNGVLLVTNTPSELDKIEQLVESIVSQEPKQVKISTKFVEITQENSDELGFDWIVSPFNIGTDMFGAGGTIGNGQPRSSADFTGPLIPGVSPVVGNVGNIMTGGNRTGDGAVARNSIDAVLNNPLRTAQNQNPAPGIMSLTGLFSDGEVKMIMRGLSQKKGADLMTAPSVTARSNLTATIEIIREFMYPEEYTEPQIPTNFGNNNQNGGGGGLPPIGGGGGIQAFPVTPASPESFTTRNTGVTLEVSPVIRDNDFLIDLRFVPEITEFEGFINYGSPITTGGTDALGNPVQIVLTENRIEMPVFSSRRVKSDITLYDGYTVAVGGLMREDVQQIEDKVPILGDIPIIGRLFQSEAENRIKSNLIVFVTAQIIDPTGRPIRGATDEVIPTGLTPEAPVGGAGMMDPSLLPDGGF